MLLEWGLIFSVTLVSATVLMIVSTYYAILPEAMQFYGESRTMILLLSNSFNIFYTLITPIMFRTFNKYYYSFVLFSTIATAVGAVARYLSGTFYPMALISTIIVAIAHIPIITAPYGLLKLFPDWQKGYAASIPLFLPVLGINFCILYGMKFISQGQDTILSADEQIQRINKLNFIIAIVGVIASALTVLLLTLLKRKITESTSSNSTPENGNPLQQVINYFRYHTSTMTKVWCWGGIVGINWTYGALFSIIFQGQGLTEQQIAVIGLAANLSTAFFSNKGTFLRNRFDIAPLKLITYLNLLGLSAAIFIQYSHYFIIFQQLAILIGAIVFLRAGYSSFVSLAMVQMEKSGISPVILSGFFFWVANIVNLLGMELVDLFPIRYSMLALTLTVSFFIYRVSESLRSHSQIK